MIAPQQEDAFTTFEAARICHVTHHSIKNWIKQGHIKASKTPGGHYRILETDFDAFRQEFLMFPKDDHTRRKQLVVIDDETESHAMIEKALGDPSWDIVSVSNATEAGIKVAQLIPNLIFLNCEMAAVDGLAICAALKGNKLSEKIPVLAAIHDVEQENIERILRTGADDYISKPYTLRELAEKLHFLLKSNGNNKRFVVKSARYASGRLRPESDRTSCADALR